MKKKFMLTTGALSLAGMLFFQSPVDAASIKVKKGDTLYSLSKKYNVSVDDMMKHNNLKNSNIYVGQELSVPGSTTAPSSTGSYTVKKGDTLYGIATKHNMTVDELKKLNGLKNNTIHAGQVLKTTGSSTPAPSKPAKPSNPSKSVTYTVKAGDTLYGIATKHNVTVDAVKSWNKLTSNIIHVGQKLTIQQNSAPKEESKPSKPSAPASALKPKTYTVKSGDTLSTIAAKHNMTYQTLMSMNSLSSTVIHPGQTLKVENHLLANPAEGRLTSNYGTRVHPISKQTTMHYGIDVAKTGTVPIKAAYGGKVIRSQWNNGWGNYVVIEHTIGGKTYATLYAHMRNNSVTVKEGDTVSKGQQIGLMGTTGNSTGQHLHLEFYVGKYHYGVTNVDPLPYFNY